MLTPNLPSKKLASNLSELSKTNAVGLVTFACTHCEANRDNNLRRICVVTFF